MSHDMASNTALWLHYNCCTDCYYVKALKKYTPIKEPYYVFFLEITNVYVFEMVTESIMCLCSL